MSFDNKIGEGKYVISVDSQGAIQQLQKFDQAAKKTGDSTAASFKTGLASAVSLASGLGSLYNQYDNLEKMQLRIRKSSLEVSRAQEEVNRLAQAGKEKTLDYQQAQERLSIAQERLSQLNGDLKQSQLAVSLSFAQTALSLPAAINGIKGLTSASSVLSVVTSKWTIIALAAVAAYEGIAQAIKITTGADYTLTTATGKLMDSMIGSNKIISEGTAEFKAYGNTISDVGIRASDTASSFVDLNKEMDRTIDKLKKNEISDRLSQVKAQMSDSMLFMGSLEYLVNTFKSAGVEGFVGELQKDLRTLKTEFGIGVDFFDALFARNFTARGMNTQQARILSGHSASVSNYFRGIVADARTGLNGLSFTKGLHGNLSFLGGITQSQTANLINGGKTGSTKSVSGSAKARSGGHGGNKGAIHALPLELAMASISGLQISSASRGTQDQLRLQAMNRYSSMYKTILEAGYSIPSFSGMQNDKTVTAYNNTINSLYKAATNVLEQRRIAEENRISSLVSRSGFTRSEVIALETTQQGTDDLYGIIDYRERLARASTGTG